MNTIIKKDKWLIIKVVAVVSALIPLMITTFEIITTDKESVVFLANYPSWLSLLVIAYYSFLIILGFLWLANQVVQQIKAMMMLRNERTQAELVHLKSQVNPHFFFNVLNSLYGLVGQDAAKAQQLILKLSDLMRYSIYDGQKEIVPVSEEVGYLQNYIELNQMRYHKKIDLQFHIEIEEDYQVMPLMFIILVENAFKHGVENLREHAFVHINMIAKADKISFSVANNFDPTEQITSSGIGLKNLKRRLELAYPDQHLLASSKQDNVYTAQLNVTKL